MNAAASKVNGKDIWIDSLNESMYRTQSEFQATFTKFNGEWMARVKKESSTSEPVRCDKLIIVTRAGKIKNEMVGKLVADFDDAYIVSIY